MSREMMSGEIYRVQIVFVAPSPEAANNVQRWVEATLKAQLDRMPANNRIELPLVGKPRELF